MSLILNLSRYISTHGVRIGARNVLRKVPQLSQSASPLRCLIRKNIVPVVSGLSLGCGVTIRAFYRNQVLCEYRPKKTRLIDRKEKEKEPPFLWGEFWRLVWPDIWYLLGAIASALAVAVVNIQIPLMLGGLVNIVSGHMDVASFQQQIRGPAFKLIYMYLIQSGLTTLYISLLSCMGERVAARLRTRLFSSLIQQDIAFFDKNKTGEIVNRLTADVQEFKSAFKQVISQGLRSITQTIGCVVSLFLLSPRLTAVLVVVVPTVVGIGTVLGSGLRILSRQAQAQVAHATAVADEAIANVRTVRAFAMEDKEIELYSQEVSKSASLLQSLGIGVGVFQGLSNAALNGIVLGTLYLGGYLMASQDIQPGDLMAFMVSTQTVQRSLAQVSLLLGTAVRGMSAGARVFEYISLQPSMPMKGGGTIPYYSMHGEVCFNGVDFTYPTRPTQKVLKDFSLTVPGGRVVALVGHSGGGKSTIASLLERFYDVDGGSITIDGHNIKNLDPSWLRGKAIGFINQEPVLFATSVLENIRYGYPHATDAEVMEAAKLANAHDFISSFPHGYNTVLGERGVTVSGGQKQRIAIARALIKRPSIIILDEATSALDAESEKVVQEALDNVIRGHTVLVIAHRLSTVRNADLIAVVAKGRIAELGTHDELKKRKGLYWDLIKQQDSGTF